jgi:DNA invertase Pin-like site-specific DNA recombinase
MPLNLEGFYEELQGAAAMTSTKEVRCALYARVSTAGQQSVPQQLEALREYASRRGWTVVQEVAEVGSGAKRRPKREALMTAARAREIDAIAVAKLDRWGRSLTDLVSTLQELTELGVGFVSVSDSIDLTTAAGRALAGMLSVFAAFERDLIVERVTAGVRHAQKHGTRSGKAIGRPALAAARAVEVRALRHQKFTIHEIAAKVGLSYGAVQRLLAGAPRKGR